MINYVTGDATDPIGDGDKIIAHVCNNRGGWGAGFVVALSKKWSEPEAQYRRWHSKGNASPHDWDGTPFILGQTVLVKVEQSPSLYVANMIAQSGYGAGDKPPIRYDALEKCLYALASITRRTANASVHMPRIGCGIAGGTWDRIEPIIENTLIDNGINVTVYDLP